MRSFWRDLGAVLMIAGAVFLIDAGVTVAWQDPMSGLIASFNQDNLSSNLDHLETVPLTSAQRQALHDLTTTGRRISFLARLERRRVRAGQALGRIRIPRIGAKYVVVEGTSHDDLTKGPGHYPDTPLPGLRGTVAIAGHRTTYLAPFHDVDELKPGDPITLDMPYGRFTYAVETTKIVAPTALYVKRPVGYDRLVLSACHPLYSAAQRIIVFARLRSTVPLGRALVG
jgi:sortase A